MSDGLILPPGVSPTPRAQLHLAVADTGVRVTLGDVSILLDPDKALETGLVLLRMATVAALMRDQARAAIDRAAGPLL